MPLQVPSSFTYPPPPTTDLASDAAMPSHSSGRAWAALRVSAYRRCTYLSVMNLMGEGEGGGREERGSTQGLGIPPVHVLVGDESESEGGGGRDVRG